MDCINRCCYRLKVGAFHCARNLSVASTIGCYAAQKAIELGHSIWGCSEMLASGNYGGDGYAVSLDGDMCRVINHYQGKAQLYATASLASAAYFGYKYFMS